MPNISVIVPVYKVEPYLCRCVDSILAQTYDDFELILVDDGSPDSCGAICEELAQRDCRIHVIHQENGGLSAARNTGIDWAFAHSDSQWLAFVDSDDWVDQTYLEQLYRAVSETGCRLSACGLYKTNGETREPSPAYACTPMSGEDYYCSREIHGGITAVAWNKLYHKSLFQTIRYPVGKLHEDEFTTYRLVYAAGNVAVIPGELYAYFQNDAGIMRSGWNPRRMHVLEAVEQQIAFSKQENHARFLEKSVMQYIFCAHDQLHLAEEGKHRAALCKKLRWGLKQGRDSGIFPLSWDHLWAYEEAYPLAKPLWWLLYRVRKENGNG